MVFIIDSFGKSIDSFDGISDNFYIKNANGNARPPKNFFFRYFLREWYCYWKNYYYEELIETLFPIKKVIFIFVIRRPFKRDLAPRKFFAVFYENTDFFLLEKLLIIKYSVPNLW